MFSREALCRPSLRWAICVALLIAAPRSAAWSQSVLDPRLLEFVPSPEHHDLLSDGRRVVTGYQAEISVAATSKILQVINLGLPVMQPDGMIRADFGRRLVATPVAGVAYVSKIVTLGPLGNSVSVPSNPFVFSPCQYHFMTTGLSLSAAGGGGTVDVSAAGIGCGWTTVISSSWVEVDSGAAADGSGPMVVSVFPNTSATARSATIAIGSATYTVSQDAASRQVVQVSTAGQLQAAVAAVTSNTTIQIAPGIYRLTSTLRIDGNLDGVVLQGSTGRAADVVLQGLGMTIAGDVRTAIWVTGAVENLQIADLTIRQFNQHAILLEAGPHAPRLSNLRLLDSGDALIKVNSSLSAPGVDDGLVENSALEYSTTGASGAAGGIDLRGVKGWVVRANAFRNVRAGGGQVARPAVSARAGSSDTVVERNLFFNCQVGVALGMTDRAGNDHRGGRIANNFFYRAPQVGGRAGISVADSPGTAIVHNTVITSNTYPAPIEYRYPDATNLVVANNLLDGPIQALDGAWAVEAGNLTNAVPDLFVYAAAGDLHLRLTAAAALDMADPSAPVAIDIDGQGRPVDRGADVGADEVDRFTNPPSVQVVQPLPNAVYKPGATIQLEATAETSNRIAFVDLYVNAVLITRLTTVPYGASLTITQPGTYSIVAVVVDQAGARSASQPVGIVINKKGR